jgi:hypothetical protein
MIKEKKQENNRKNELAVDAKKNIFHYDELKQSDPKMSNQNWISPDYNPGCLKRVKSSVNQPKKYRIEKELYYMRDGKKVIMSKDDLINFIKERK